jgi:hypothetical protein
MPCGLPSFRKAAERDLPPSTPRQNNSGSKPSKGLDLYSYISAAAQTDTYTIKFEVNPGTSFLNTRNDNFSVKQLEVEATSLRSCTGRFQWSALKNGAVVASGWNDINALTGQLERGTMLATKHNLPIVLPDNVIVVYGFYQSGPGIAGLPNRHQCYVIISPGQSNWMSTVAAPGTPAAEKPVSSFALAAAHDAGMFDGMA